ncbi:MAG: class I SAM-dependent RNA methyltransferase [Gemmatimonadetes bacterium]|nr:class I SAM-dependent RNA methyltransferase [Gemmatimonadota bacterium]
MVATARIESIAAGGAGVSRVDGLVVFTPRTAPGDLVELSYVQRDRLGQGRLKRVLEASNQRVEPRCRHYAGDRCGGCQLQHLGADAQRDAKRRIVADAFVRIGKRPVEVPPVVPSPVQWGYRNKLTLALRWRGGAWRGGMHRWDDVDAIFELVECPITHPRVVAGWRGVLQDGRLLPRARELRGSVRLADEQLALVIEGGTHWPHAREFAALLVGFSAVRWIDSAGRTHDLIAHDLIAHDRIAVDRLALASARPIASFEQVNPAVAALLHADVVARIRALSPRTVIDAYAGVGEVSIALAAGGAQVTAIESDPDAAAHATRGLAPPSRVVCARVEDVLAAALPADAVILNPPRAGVDARVCAVLESAIGQPDGPRGIVYVSCNPATLARDVARLPSYRVAEVQPYDMFPQTAHVETVCLLVPER